MKLGKKAVKAIGLMAVMSTLVVGAVGCGSNNSTQTSTGGNTTTQTGQTGGDSSGGSAEPVKEAPFNLQIMTTTYTGEPLKGAGGAKVKEVIEEYTNTKIEFIWVPDSAYDDRMNIMLASNDMPHVMLVGGAGKHPSIINAANAGALWELSPYINDYKNLSQMHPVVMQNASFEGDVYGIYRARNLGRNGMYYRQDWLENVGLEAPKTIDDFYEMLVAFTNNDPNKSGQKDTYGLAMCSYTGPFDVMQTWFGVPNGWGETADGTLYPAHTTPEYLDALNFFRKLYQEGLINQDFAVLDSSKWADLIRTGKGGVIVDVVDGAHRTQEYFDNNGIDGKIAVQGAVEGPYGLRNLPTAGYSGIFVMTKKAKTEDELKRVLQFMDDMNDAEMRNLADFGIEGVHYTLDANGDVVRHEDPNVLAEINDANQLMTYVIKDGAVTVPMTDIRRAGTAVQEANESIVIGNPAYSYVSSTYSTRGPQLDEIISDSRIQYVVGQIDEATLKAQHDLWLANGGQNIINEMNEIHARNK
jgi:putative aldouronate transport system substrate-binding protein